MQTLTVIAMGVLALGMLIFVHELGHFMVAKWAGIKVLKFSLGFGTKLIGFKHGETEYLISALPLGGYVKMAGENPNEVKPDALEAGDYFARPWYIRLLVLIAGPGMNFITAILVLSMLYAIGFNVPIAKPQVVEVDPNLPAAAAGVEPGDVITGINAVAVTNWEKFSEQLSQVARTLNGEAMTLHLERAGEQLAVNVTPIKDDRSDRWKVGIAIAPHASTVIDRVIVGTPAEMQGMQIGDQIMAVEGQPVWSKYDFQKLVWPRAEQATRLLIKRGDKEQTIQLTPIGQQFPGQGKVGVIGVGFKSSDQQNLVKYPPGQAIGLGLNHTMNMSKLILSSLGQMITGKISAKDSLGGPITIMRMAGQEARSGIKDFLFFISGISIMLAILNLLPIPVLDGGSAVFFIIEGIIGRPLSLKVQERSQQIGFFALIALMLYATANDIYKLVASTLGG